MKCKVCNEEHDENTGYENDTCSIACFDWLVSQNSVVLSVLSDYELHRQAHEEQQNENREFETFKEDC